MAEKTLDPGAELKPERVQSRLKSERVQSRLKSARVQTRLKSERVQSRLKELPGWEAARGGKALQRTYLFPTIRAAVALVALTAEIGEANGYSPDIDLRHLEVTLRVATNTEAGITDLDFDVARRFDPQHSSELTRVGITHFAGNLGTSDLPVIGRRVLGSSPPVLSQRPAPKACRVLASRISESTT